MNRQAAAVDSAGTPDKPLPYVNCIVIDYFGCAGTALKYHNDLMLFYSLYGETG